MALSLSLSDRDALILSITTLFLGVFFAVIFPPYRTPMIIYTLLAGISTLIYGLSEIFGESLFGINTKNIADQILLGIGMATVFLLIKIAVPTFAIGNVTPSLSVSSSVTFLILAVMAPLVEETLFRGSLLGFIYWAESNGEAITLKSAKFWVANVIQATAFMLFHALAYNENWYSLPSATAVGASFLANASPFIAAFTWGLFAGAVDSMEDVRSLIPGITGHAIINFLVFTSLSVVGLSIVPAMSLAVVANVIIVAVPNHKKIINKAKGILFDG